LNDAIIGGLDVVKDALEREALPKEVKSMVVFLTDGLPSTGTTDPDTIRSNIKEDNRDLQIPVFGRQQRSPNTRVHHRLRS